MLKQLYIKNFALIDTLDIELSNGFSVITGETGAGKSIILGAIGLLLGQRADSRSVKVGAQKCIIEATFSIENKNTLSWFTENDIDVEDDECIIRRELNANGKSRSFINDTPVSLQMLRELGDMLVDVHSQHQNLLLNQEDFQLNTIDNVAQNSKELEAYKTAYSEFVKAKKELENLKALYSENRKQEEFLKFQLEELEKADLKEGEQAELEQEQEVASHTEEIKSAMFEADNLLQGEGVDIVSSLKKAINRLESISNVLPAANELCERLNSVYLETKDIAAEVSDIAANIEFNPKRLEYITDRLNTIYSLQKKYNISSVEELIEEYNRIKLTVNGIENSDEEIKEKEKLVEELLSKAKAKADALTKSRVKATKSFCCDVLSILKGLGMPNVEFTVDVKKQEISACGQDKVEFLFSANKGIPMRPIADIASGGEIARVMLTLKAIICRTIKLPTILFDEIDTGVSGAIAEKMAEIMHQMGTQNHQVLSITHLPQIAAYGSSHFKVEKNSSGDITETRMRKLSDDERIREIAQMLSGANITESAIENAKTLLKR